MSEQELSCYAWRQASYKAEEDAYNHNLGENHNLGLFPTAAAIHAAGYDIGEYLGYPQYTAPSATTDPVFSIGSPSSSPSKNDNSSSPCKKDHRRKNLKK